MLERLKWVTERQRRIEFEQAMGERNRADGNITSAESSKPKRKSGSSTSNCRAPALPRRSTASSYPAISLRRSAHRCSADKNCFEIAPLDSYRVALEVDESQIGDIAIGQKGRLVVTSLPDEVFPLAVNKITPVAKAHDGHNFFRVEARSNDAASQLRPGMRGAAKIDVDGRRLVWIWTQSFIDWVALFAWRWFG